MLTNKHAIASPSLQEKEPEPGESFKETELPLSPVGSEYVWRSALGKPLSPQPSAARRVPASYKLFPKLLYPSWTGYLFSSKR